MTDNAGWGPLAREIRRIFMIHGPPGVGKTYMLGTAVRGTGERMAILDYKGGTNTIADLAGKILPDGKPQVIVARGLDRFNKTWGAISKVEQYVNAGMVQWVVVDNISDMTSVFMREIRSVEYPTAGGKASIPKKSSIRDYGICQQWIQDTMNWLMRLPVNLVFTAWTRRPKSGESEGIPRAESEGISDLITGDCEHVFYLKKIADSGSTDDIVVDDSKPVATSRVLITDSMDYLARSRGGHLPPAMEPNFRKVIEILEQNGL